MKSELACDGGWVIFGERGIECAAEIWYNIRQWLEQV